MRTTILTAALACLAAPAAAEWLHEESGGAFDGAPTHMAFTATSPFALGLRCTSQTITSVLLTTPEVSDADSVAALGSLDPVILLVVDGGAVFEAPAEASLNSASATVMMTGESPDGFADALAGARESVSSAVRVAGRIFYETEFDARGSTAAVTSMLEGCTPG